MAVLVSSISYLPTSTVATPFNYHKDDVQLLKDEGADDVIQIVVGHSSKSAQPPALGLFGVKDGVIMNAGTDWVALPCPEYCKDGTDTSTSDWLTPAEARARVTGS